ncbi:MAG: hypothetical protein U5O39_06580 [Gammaproteobacteria bacterium]|nr:hypothetical protein [Gammaproteobacteria bacterium]
MLSSDAAASFLINYCTAYHGLIDCAHLKEGETVLILGAAGGVGMAAIDVARAAGAVVVAAASTKKKREACSRPALTRWSTTIGRTGVMSSKRCWAIGHYLLSTTRWVGAWRNLRSVPSRPVVDFSWSDSPRAISRRFH